MNAHANTIGNRLSLRTPQRDALDILARGADGSTYVWLARTRRIGTGEGSADLRFDRAVDAPPPAGA